MSSVPYSAAANLSQQFRDYVYGPATQAEIDAARAGVSNQFRSSVYTGAPSGMDPVVVDPNTVSTGYGGARAAGANNYIYGYADVARDANGNVISGVSAPYGPMDGGYRLNSPALDQQVRDAERQVFLERAAQMQAEMQLQADARNIGRPYGVSQEPQSSRGAATGLLPTQLAQALANYDNGTYRGDPVDLFTDYFSLPESTQQTVYDRYSSQSNSQNKSVPTPNQAQQQYKQAATQNAQAPRRPSYSGPPVSFPSYSGNPAGGYTNVTQLGPVNAGPVTITQNEPYDMGWGTQSSYDPNTGLSKWSTSGLTNGEMYYDNLYAGRFADEAARRQAQAASAAAAQQNRAAGFARQDLINMVVDGMVANGMDRSMARVQARNMSENELGAYMQQIESAAANAQRDAPLNDLLAQFANPNYGSVQTPLPSYTDPGTQQAPTYTLEQQNADIMAAINNPDLTPEQRRAAISSAQQALVASRALAQQQQQASAGTTGNVQQQYDQAVQQQSQMQQDLIQQYQDAMNQANQANQARYEDAIAGYQNMRDNISGYLDSQGQQAQEDINRQYDRFGASSDQDLMNRGLSNTTVRSSVQRGVEEDRGRALRNSQEQIDRQRLGFETTAQQGLLDFMERRTDQAPSYGDLANLAQGLGTAGGGSGTGVATSPGTGAGAAPSYGSGSGGVQYPTYNPVFNTGGVAGQGPTGQGQQTPQQQQQSEPAYVPSTVSYAGDAMQQPGEDPVAWANRVSPANQFQPTGGTPGVGPINTSNAGAQGQTGAPMNINPWTNPVEAQKAGQMNQQQRSINMRSSGMAGIPSYNNQSTIKRNSYSSTQGPGTGTKTIIPGNNGWTDAQAQMARDRMRGQSKPNPFGSLW